MKFNLYNTNNGLELKYGLFIVKRYYKKVKNTQLTIYFGNKNVVILF